MLMKHDLGIIPYNKNISSRDRSLVRMGTSRVYVIFCYSLILSIIWLRFTLWLEDSGVMIISPALRSMRQASGLRWGHYLQQWPGWEGPVCRTLCTWWVRGWSLICYWHWWCAPRWLRWLRISRWYLEVWWRNTAMEEGWQNVRAKRISCCIHSPPEYCIN